ncbi:MAG TPA: hypothetical protein VM409_07050, partial [Chloroflexia bacterium]|nr:hypothetical protein [Chloroflexia bacterium]
MSWHVMQGRYYMAYDSKAQPQDLAGNPGEHSALIIVHIENGLVSTDGASDGCHFTVGGIDLAIAQRWTGSNASMFQSGGVGRIYFFENATGD